MCSSEGNSQNPCSTPKGLFLQQSLLTRFDLHSSPDIKSMENKEPSKFTTPEKAPPAATTETGMTTPEQPSEEAALAEFRRKHPDLAAAPGNILQRKMRLERGHKYFDSGDYNMAKAKSVKEGVTLDIKLAEELDGEMGDDHPTPDSIPHKKYPPAPGISKLAL
ncbi:hypothetical protein BV898_13776 [Hypsibius exemplaris]|uniref:cAMP-regulated phosphoprotein 19 n=1 Tax=Hypsibius exemplaris TaxID=2072580 RepID=A0A1W0W9L6_HYPEX|nr:hypothetical protein BV898_13776 [Hypsibius exemplaris]